MSDQSQWKELPDPTTGSFRWVKVPAPTPFEYRPPKTADVRCHHCHLITRTPLHTVEADEARYWRERYETLLGHLNESIAECRTLHGDDPMRLFMERRLIKLRDDLSNP